MIFFSLHIKFLSRDPSYFVLYNFRRLYNTVHVRCNINSSLGPSQLTVVAAKRYSQASN